MNTTQATRLSNAIGYWLNMRLGRHDKGGQQLVEQTLADLRWRLTQA
jgi:hypothetical protein